MASACAAQPSPGPPEASLSAADRAAFQVVWETLGQVERDYYRADQLDPRKLAAGAARGMVEAVGDPVHQVARRPAEPSDVQAELRGRFDGIGATLDARDGRLRVVSTIPGAPAERAGLRSGDEILTIDDVPSGRGCRSRTRPADSAGPRARPCRSRLLHDGSNDPLMVAIARAEIRVPSVEGRLLDGSPSLGVRAHQHLWRADRASSCTNGSGRCSAPGARGIVLDLRGNPGGYLTSAVDVDQRVRAAMAWCSTSRSDRRPRASARRSAPAARAQAPDVPLVVLVDGGSASAAEIVAAALRENQRAVLVGAEDVRQGHRPGAAHAQRRLAAARHGGAVAHAERQAIQGQGLLPDVRWRRSTDATPCSRPASRCSTAR